MGKIKKNLIVLTIATLSLIIFTHCKKFKEEPPFFDGLFMEYDYGGGLKLIYNVEVLPNNKFKIIQKDTFFKASPSRGIKDIFVDKYGMVYKSSFKAYEGAFSPIWIPSDKIEIGDDIFDGEYTAIREDKWKEWNVLVVKAKLVEEEKYFDLNTGFWVGSFAKTAIGASKIILVNTNADIPTLEE